MATFYIDPTARTGGDGTFATPFDSWADVTWTDGNTYLQKEGTTFFGSITVSTGGTSLMSLVSLGAYDASTGSRIYLNPMQPGNITRMPKINANGAQIGILVSNGRNFTHITDLEVFGARHTSSATGIYPGSGASTDNVVQRCYVHDIKHTNQSIGSAAIRAFALRLKILDCRITDIGDDGIYCEGTGIEIARNFVDRCSAETVGGDCVQMANSTLSVSDFWIHHNVLKHDDLDVKQCFIVTTVGAGGASSRGIFEHNQCLGYIGALLHKPVYIGSADAIIRNNFISGGIRSIDLVTEATGALVYGNIIVNASSVVNTQGIVVTANDQQIYNNTIINTNSVSTSVNYGIQQASTYTGVVIKNNIIMGWVYGVRVAASNPADENYNVFYNTLLTNKVNNSLVEQTIGANSVVSNPLLNTQYVPQNSSPVVGAGVFYGGILDLNQNPYLNPPSIGAYEYVSPRLTAGTRGTR